MLDFDTYQDESAKTAKASQPGLANWTIGLAGETGEVAELVKHYLYHHSRAIDLEKLAEELGDVLWYLTQIATHFEIDLHEIATGNLEKLRKKHPECWEEYD